MIYNQFHNDLTLCSDPGNLNYNFDHIYPHISMNKLNILKYNLNMLYVLQLNCRSIVKNFVNLKLLLNSIDNTLDVISICETWFNEFNMNLFELQGYTSFHTIRNHIKASCVSIYINSSFTTNTKFNIDILKVNTITDFLKNTIQLQNLFKSINQSTRISNNRFTLIDNIFYNGNLSYILSGILQYEFTDHLPN